MKCITKEYTIWCDACANWEQRSGHSNQQHFVKLMTKCGWKVRDGKALCPSCVGKPQSPVQ
jgi:hypothetical protein